MTKAQAAAILFGDAEVMFSAFLDGKKDEYSFAIKAAELPWEESADRLIAAMLQMTGRHVIYRAEKARKESGIEPGKVDAKMLGKAILSVTFQGDPTPNKDDVKTAKAWHAAVLAEKFTWAQIKEKIESKGFTLKSEDEAGLALYFMQDRVKKSQIDLDLI